MKWKCIIVDDEPSARKLLKEFVAKIQFLELIADCENPVKASTIMNSASVDIMFLDINMPIMNGLDFLKTMLAPPTSIITSAYSEFALMGFELNVMDYLLKPFSFQRFLLACTKASEYLRLLHQEPSNNSNSGINYFFVKCNGRIEKILFDELEFVEAKENYVLLHTSTRKLLVYLTLKAILEKLPQQRFLKVHKSSIINIDKVSSIQGNVVNIGSASVAMSQNLYDMAMKVILNDRMIRR
jgi:DNA-binding LytR/AlgR family response regulator